ncbi:MAG: serine--tRNA ligase, partial [Arenicellales bacterium]
MLDPQLIRSQLGEIAKRLKIKGYQLDVELLGSLEARRKTLQTEQQELQAKRNSSAKEVGRLKAAGQDASELIGQTAGLGERLSKLDHELESVKNDLDALLAGIPNIPHASVPEGKDENANVELR